jgi:hypothetical protein
VRKDGAGKPAAFYWPTSEEFLLDPLLFGSFECEPGAGSEYIDTALMDEFRRDSAPAYSGDG